MQSWVDISNDRYGVTWASLDAPLIELGAIQADAEAVGYVDEIGPTTVLYSYLMNNYWFTNFRAAQSGPTRFRYAIAPHTRGYKAAAAAKFGEERAQPLIVVSVAAAERERPLLQVWPRDVHVSAQDCAKTPLDAERDHAVGTRGRTLALVVVRPLAIRLATGRPGPVLSGWTVPGRGKDPPED